MANLNELFPSKWIRQTDLDEDLNVEIVDVVEEELGVKKELKWVLYFNNEKAMSLNKTNTELIQKAHPDVKKTDELVGKLITLYWNPEVSFGGELTGGVRIRTKAPAKADIPF